MDYRERKFRQLWKFFNDVIVCISFRKVDDFLKKTPFNQNIIQY